MQSGQRTLIAEHCCAARTRLICWTCSSWHFVALRQWRTLASDTAEKKGRGICGGGYFGKTLSWRRTRTRCAELGILILISFCGRLHRARPWWCDTAVCMRPATRIDVADDTPGFKGNWICCRVELLANAQADVMIDSRESRYDDDISCICGMLARIQLCRTLKHKRGHIPLANNSVLLRSTTIEEGLCHWSRLCWRRRGGECCCAVVVRSCCMLICTRTLWNQAHDAIYSTARVQRHVSRIKNTMRFWRASSRQV